MELDIFDEINLFEDVEQENEKYINAIEALELMAYKTNNSITNVARRLLLDEFNKTAYMFKLNEFEKIELYCSEKGFDGGYVITTEFLKLAISTLGTFDYVETDIYGNEYEYSQADWFDYYWLKSDYFQCVARFGVAETDIKKLKAFEAMRSFQFIQERQIEAEQSEQDQRLKADFKVISEIFMDEVKEFDEKELQQTDPNIESLNAEIARLRQENEDKNKIVVELQERIKELEALQPNEQVEIQINQPESELTPEQEIPHSRQRGNVRKIIAVLVDMARLPSEPYTAFNMLDAHAQANGMELPSKDTTTKWTHNSS